MEYKQTDLGTAYKIDILVENKVIIEVKSVTKLEPVHHKQLLTYLKTTGCKLGYLVNFDTKTLKDNLIRYVNRL